MNTWKPYKKYFGQNFLQDKNIINNIIYNILPKNTDHIVEIGPGQGALSIHLTDVKKLTMIEIDLDMVNILKNIEILQKNNINIINQDVLKVNFAELEPQPLRVIGNLPYNISTPLLIYLFKFKNIITDMHFMLQKEVIDRMVAQPNTKQYGRLSIITQYFCQVKKLFNVPANAFYPKPKVISSIIKLIPYNNNNSPYPEINPDLLQKITQQAFSGRRKKISNSLKNLVTQKQLIKLNISPDLRAENLSVLDFINIGKLIS